MDEWFVWLARLMFVGIFALGIGMLYRAWSIGVRRDLRYVADWRGRPVQNGARWAQVVLGFPEPLRHSGTGYRRKGRIQGLRRGRRRRPWTPWSFGSSWRTRKHK